MPDGGEAPCGSPVRLDVANGVFDKRKAEGSKKGLMGPPSFSLPVEEESIRGGITPCLPISIDRFSSPAAMADEDGKEEDEEGEATLSMVAPAPTVVAVQLLPNGTLG